MSKLEKYFYYFLLFLAVYIIVGFKLIPYIAHDQLIKNLDKTLNLKSHIQKVEFNPFTLSAKIKNYKLGDLNKPTISFKEFSFDFGLLESIFKSHINIEAVKLDKLYVKVIEENNSFNIQKLLKPTTNTTNEETKKQTKKQNIKFLVSKILLSNSQIDFSKKEYNLSLNSINYAIYNLGSFNDALASSSLSLKINDSTLLEKQGAFKIAPYFDMYGKASLENLKIKQFITYKKDILNFELNKNARFDLALDYDLNLKNNLDLNVETTKLQIKNINIKQKEKEVVKLKSFQINKILFSLLKNDIKVSNSLLDGLYTNIVKDKEYLNLATLVLSKEKESKDKEPEKEVNPWKIDIKNTKLQNINLNLNDLENKMHLDASNMSLFIDRTSLIKDTIDISNIEFNEPLLTLKNQKEKTYISAKDINVKVSNLRKDPKNLSVSTSSLNDAILHVKLLKKEKTSVVKKEETKVKEVNKEKLFLDIGEISINKTKLIFEDENLPLEFKTQVSDLNGHISSFKTNYTNASTLKVNGLVDEYGIANISGLVTPLDIKFLTDVRILLKNIAIKNYSPYSAKFVGRKIDSGKLDLDLKYDIQKSKLDANNSIIISKIKLGEDVKSENAISLPLGLAIALIEDSNGIIDLEIPITGDIDNPKFEITPLIWKTFVNIIKKAITAPFNFLASTLGLDEEKIKYVKFDFAQSDITAIQKESLDNLAKVLSKKPKLKLELKPSYDEIKDTIALKNKKFNILVSKSLANKQIKNYESKYKKLLESLYEKKFNNKADKKESKDNEYIKMLESSIKSKIIISKKEKESLGKKRALNMKNYLLNIKRVNSNQLLLKDELNIQNKSQKVFKFELALKI